MTRCGHYYLDHRYNFVDSCDIGKLESHKNYVIMFVRSGMMEFETSHSFSAEQGQLALIDCRKPHRFYTRGMAENMWIHFDGANSHDFFEQIIALHGGRQVFTPSPNVHVEQELAQIISGIRGATMTEVDCSQHLYHILCALLFPQSGQRGLPDDSPVAAAIRYINRHLFDPLSVADVSEHVNLSAAHFSRLFRSTTGFSPHEYIVLHRIDAAKSLLHSSALSVKEIAFRVGYRSEVNFIASFTDKVGVSPSVFRKNIL